VDALPSPEAEPWADKLQEHGDWNEQDLEEFARYLKSEENYFDRWTIFRAFDDETIEYFYSLDVSLAKLIALEYCRWVGSTAFDFNYCDVLIGRLINVVGLGDFDVKVAAIMGAAEMAVEHNRWFVMGHVMKLCGPTMDDQLAERLAIEIIVEGAHKQFKQCAERLSKSITEYHTRIAEILA
jgi:eukaryotic-like serine/threonine-protein kinase